MQVQGLLKDVEQAQLPARLPDVYFLRGRILIGDPQADAATRVAGIEDLRRAATAYRSQGRGEELAAVLEVLKDLTGSTDFGPDPSAPASSPRTGGRAPLPSLDSLNEAGLVAIVSQQERAIAALSDSQVRSELLLERQERQLNDFAFQVLNDSVTLLQQSMALNEQSATARRLRTARNLYLAIGGIVLLLLAGLYYRFRTGQKRRAELERYNAEITAERQRSEELLLNILPVAVAAELKEEGKASARSYAAATILFADFKGFSALSQTHSPEKIVGYLDEAFRAFDEIVRTHRLEKIKTIGDAYMCAAGLPEEDPGHAANAVRAALAMQEYLATHPFFKARIGLHTGPVVAGVVGRDKFAYDVWGDTVNQAARLETAGEPGRVAISRVTADLLPADEFTCTPAGTFEAKNMGTMERLWVERAG